MDRCFLELQLDGEEAYLTYLRVIENANVILATYQDEAMGDLQVCCVLQQSFKFVCSCCATAAALAISLRQQTLAV